MKHKAIDVTEYFRSDDSPEGIIYKALPMSIETKTDDDGKVSIEGWASTKDEDLAKDIVEPGAFKSSLAEYNKRGTMLFMHDWYGVPVGKFTKVEIKDNGLWVEGTTNATSQGKDVAIAIDDDTLDALSIGFSIKKSETDEETGIRTITDLKLYEISVVNAGMNPQAVFTQMKSLGLTVPLTDSPDNRRSSKKERTMSGATLDQEQLDLLKQAAALVPEHATALETVSGDISKLKTNIDAQGDMLKEVIEKHAQFKEGIITKAELEGFTQKLGNDILEIQKSIQKGKVGLTTNPNAMPASMVARNWKLLPEAKDIVLVRDDDGRPLSPLQQKAYKLFEQPVTFDDSEWSHWLKNLRDVQDICTLVYAYYRGKRGLHVGDIAQLQNLKSFQLLHAMLDKTDPEFAKAMYSTGTNLGDEWVPTLMSATLFDLYRLTPSIESYIPSFEMPSNPFDWPIKTGSATLYVASEAAVNNPNELTKSNIATDKVTFDAGIFAVAVVVSPELIEDAIIAMASEIRTELAITARTGYEKLLVNGDNTATHRDTGGSYTSVNPENYEDGFRWLAKDRSATYNMQSTTAGIGNATSTFGAEDMRYARKVMGKWGTQPSQCAYVVNTDGWFHVMNLDQFAKPGDYGAGNTWRTGTLMMADGCDIIISEQLQSVLSSTGQYTGASTFTGLICFNKTAFKIGSKRGMTVEFEKNILTQQWAFVGTMRKSFQCMAPSTEDPVAYGVNFVA